MKQSIPCQISDLGLIDYKTAYDIQKSAVLDVISGSPQKLFFCEHKSILTLGRLTKKENLLTSESELKSRGVEVVSIDRGGDITLHCPGQLICYPIFDLDHYGKDLKAFLSQLEQVVIDLLSEFGIVATRFEGRTGVWVKNKKICSLGIGVKKWVTFHGVGLNVNSDLCLFQMIRPCGLDVLMTSMAQELGQTVDMADVKIRISRCFKKQFQLENR